MFRPRSFWPIWCLLLVTLLACSLGGPAPQAAPPTATATAVTVQEPTITLPPAAPTQPPAGSADQLTATAEPAAPPATNTTAPTATVTRTPRPSGVVVTVQRRGTAAPLTVNYEVVEVKREAGDEAMLTLKVIATGGGGGYRYYHDDVAQPGAVFKVPGRCGKPFVHTIKVTAANGQAVSLPYHVGGLCPTPTP